MVGAYKWLDRFDEHRLERLKDRSRSGRGLLHLYQKKSVKDNTGGEISENPSAGWQVKQVMDIIYKKTGTRYHEVHIYRLLHKWWGFSPKVPQRRFVNTASK